jgi:hypothetical protein
VYCRQEFATKADARAAIKRRVEIDCNRRRRHSTIDYQIPAEKIVSFFEKTVKVIGRKRRH